MAQRRGAALVQHFKAPRFGRFCHAEEQLSQPQAWCCVLPGCRPFALQAARRLWIDSRACLISAPSPRSSNPHGRPRRGRPGSQRYVSGRRCGPLQGQGQGLGLWRTLSHALASSPTLHGPQLQLSTSTCTTRCHRQGQARGHLKSANMRLTPRLLHVYAALAPLRATDRRTAHSCTKDAGL